MVVIDTEKDKVVGDIPNTNGVHAIAIAHKFGKGFTSNGRDNSVSIFDVKTLKVVGTVNSVEFFLAVSVSIAFIANLGVEEILGPTLGLIIGGVVAAPIGAMMAKRFSPKLMLVMVGIVLTATSAFGLYRALI